MKVYFYENGRFEKATGDSIFQESNNANKIQLKLPMAKNDSIVHATFLLPYPKGSDQYGQYAAESLLLTVKVDEVDGGYLWESSLPGGYLVNSGKAYLSAKIQTQDLTTIKTTEQVEFTIEASGEYVATEVLPEQAEQIFQNLAELNSKVLELESKKQDKEDQGLQTVNKTVVGAINEVNAQSMTNTAILEDHETRITKNETDIVDLQEKAISGLNRVGTFPTQKYFPIDKQLNDFVLEIEGRPVRNGDWVEFTKADTQNRYKIYYTANKWQAPDLQAPIEKTENDRYGVIKGNDFVNMANGEVQSISTRNLTGVRENIEPRINGLNRKQNEIVSGEQIVGESGKATKDSENNVIHTTYAKQSDVYTKSEADDKYLSKTYTNIYYYSKDGIVDDLPTTPIDEKQFEITTNNVGSFTIFDISRFTTAKYNFNKNTTDQSSIWISADRDCVAQFRLTTKANKDGVEKLLNTEITGELRLTADTLTNLQITSIYNALGNEEYELDIGQKFIKQLEVITTDATATKFAVYCGETNASTVNLVAQSISFNVNTINGKKKIEIKANEWVDNGDGTYTLTITPLRHEQAPSNEYGLDLQYQKSANSVQRIAFTPEITDDGTIKITSYSNIDCQLLVWSSISEAERGIFKLTNPKTIPEISYAQYGAINITQTEEPTALTLPNPKNVSYYYSVFVSNNKQSTKKINVNGLSIEIGQGIKFKWVGNGWVKDDTPDKTSEITDDLNNQPLNDTLKGITNKANKNGDNIQPEVWKNILGVTTLEESKTNSKSIELKEGIAIEGVPVTTLVDLFKFFYYKRKDQNPIYELEVGNGKNKNVTNILGFPYGESPTRPGSIVFERGSTSGIGFVINCQFVGEDSKTSHIGAIKGWIISGTAYDNKIHFTGWNSLTPKWDIIIKDTYDFKGGGGFVGSYDSFTKSQDNSYIVSIKKNDEIYNGILVVFNDIEGTVTIPLDDELITYHVTKTNVSYMIGVHQSVDRIETLEITVYGRR